MKTTKIISLLAIILVALFAVSCAPASPVVVDTTQHVYGFWGGVWHGGILFFDWIAQLFSDNVGLYAFNNNGGWYNFGFFLGVNGFLWGLIKLGGRIIAAIFS